MIYDDPYFTYDFQHISGGKERYRLSWVPVYGEIYEQTIFIKENGEQVANIVVNGSISQFDYDFRPETTIEWWIRTSISSSRFKDSQISTFIARHPV